LLYRFGCESGRFDGANLLESSIVQPAANFVEREGIAPCSEFTNILTAKIRAGTAALRSASTRISEIAIVPLA
jgi:hypothetical protein